MGGVPGGVSAEERARTPTEEIVASVWAAELQLPHIGLNEDFIDLGSHSLQGTAIVARLTERFGVSIPVRVLFEEPTVADLAAWIDHRGGETHGAEIEFILVQEGRGLRPIFAVPGGGAVSRGLYGMAKLARETDPGRPVFAFPGDPPVPANTPKESWVQAAAGSLTAAVRTKQRHGPYLLFGSCVGGIIAWEMARQLEGSGEIVHLFLNDTQHPRLRTDAESRSPAEKRMRRLARIDRRRLQDASAPERVGETVHKMPKDRKLRLEMTRAYRPEPLVGRVRLIANADWHRSYPTLGWDELVGDCQDVAVRDGGHALLRNFREVATWLRAQLDEVDPQPQSSAPAR